MNSISIGVLITTPAGVSASIPQDDAKKQTDVFSERYFPRHISAKLVSKIPDGNTFPNPFNYVFCKNS